MWRQIALVGFCLLAGRVLAEVHVYVEQGSGFAWIKYQCTDGEVVRAWPLDVSVDAGRISGISEFFVGESTTSNRGYGIFPAAFRDHITVGPSSSIDWAVGDYTPVAVVADNPSDTLPGLGSAGVTLEFGAVWDPTVPSAVPGPTGTLCALQISQGATVSVAANGGRGGVVAADPDMIVAPIFTGAFVQPPEVTGFALTNGAVTILFAGGELETAPAAGGPWTGSGDTSGVYGESVAASTNRFFRVRNP